MTARNRGMSADGILAEDVASVTADKRAIGLNCADSPTNTTSSPRRRGGNGVGRGRKRDGFDGVGGSFG